MVFRRHEKGVSTIAAVMMIIILGILGVAFMSLLGSEQYGYLNHYESAQSFYSAEAGVEWGMHEKTSTPAPIPFADGTISVSVIDNSLISTGNTDRGERVIQVQILPANTDGPSEGCESIAISNRPTYSPYTTVYDNPTGGVGDTVYVKVKTTQIVGCSGGTATLKDAEIQIENLQCPQDDVKYDTVGDWSCTGPTTADGCTDYYEYTIAVTLPSGWSDTTASVEIKLDDNNNEFLGHEIITIGQGDCSSVQFFSDSGYTTEVDPWEFEKGSTYYMRVITDNLNGNTPQNDDGELEIRDFADDRIFRDKNFFTRNGTQDITCGGTTYSYGSYEGSFTVPDASPGGGSDWEEEPTADWYYNFEIKMKVNSGNCDFKYMDSLRFIAGSGGGGGGGGGGNPPPAGPLDEAGSESTATQANNPGGGWRGAKGGSDQILIQLINETDVDIVITGFDLSSTTSQPDLKHFQTRTAANGWNKEKIWDGDISLPTGTTNLNEGASAERTIPANSLIIIDDLHFQDDINPGTFTLVIYFEGGVSSTLNFSLP